MSQDPLDYNLLLQEALRGLVRRSLEIVAEGGLPGAHHLYIGFRTDFPGVEMPGSLRASYPEEMTIVLQHQFQDLEVGDDAFSVGLYFGSVLQYLTVPFEAVLTFADPGAGLQLAFQPMDGDAPEAGAEPADDGPSALPEGAEEAGNVVSFERFRNK
jgi:hypothetical protein